MAFLWEKQAAEKAALLLEQLNPDHLPVSLVGELGAFSFREELRTLGWNCVETEKPNSAAAVMATLRAVTFPVPSARVSRSLFRLETMVPSEMIMERIPAQDTGTPSSGYMVGQADPSRESGRPRLIKAV